MRGAVLIISISSLVAAIVTLLVCLFLLMTVMHLEADLQNSVNAPMQGGQGFLVP
jgi:hypothetical protein